MKIAVFSTKIYDKQFLREANREKHDFTYFETALTDRTVSLAEGHEAVCVFVNDSLHASVLEKLAGLGVRLIALRCAGFNNVNLETADKLNLTILRVPAYSPYAVAEHTVALMLSLNRKIHRAYNRVKEGNFALDGLLGFDMMNRTVGVIGTGKIGRETIRILLGFGCHVLCFDPFPNPAIKAMGATYTTLDTLVAKSDIVTLHCPLTPETTHIINANLIAKMKRGVMIINTSRGSLVNTQDVIDGLKSGLIGYLGLDVYEEEADLFFTNLSETIIQDDLFMRLTTFPNVLITGHQAFFTEDALRAIAETTVENISMFEIGTLLEANRVNLNLVR